MGQKLSKLEFSLHNECRNKGEAKTEQNILFPPLKLLLLRLNMI